MPPRLQPLSGLSRNGTSRVIKLPLRTISTTPAPAQEVTSEPPASTPAAVLLDPNLVSTRQQELRLQRAQHANPVGSRRRRAALQHAANIPFTQLPYQCFQEARKILQADREDKLKQIAAQRAKIERLSATEAPKDDQGAVHYKARRLRSMRDHLEKLKIHADINDPIVKKKFEDGQGDMTKPIYRFLANRKWRDLKRKIVMQRITQMSVVPDVLPSLDPVVDVDVSFGRRRYPPGEFVPSIISEQAPRINLQVFDAGEKTVTLAVVDSDVPNLETDGFDNRCHFLASNIKISATTKSINLANLTEGDVILPWVPPTAQKGAPYHRLSVIVLEQHIQGGTADLIKKDTALAKWPAGKDFKLRDFASNNRLRATGVTMFRTQWDEYMDGVMRRQGIADVDMELKRRRVDPLPYKWTPKMGKKYR